jgi:mRNA-degrading endonuclease toxin of MazEF toxin-antitoxin module
LSAPLYAGRVSNNVRNRNLGSVFCARVSASPSRLADIPSLVPIEDRGSVVGKVLCDDLRAVRKTRLQRLVGALPGRVLVDVNKGIRSALDCEP